jgi:dihydrofolate reductase
VYVLSSRPLPDGTPDDVIHVTGLDDLVRRLRAEEGDVELLGGPSLIRAFWQRGEIDELGLLLLPVLFGDGLPLFPLGASREPLTLTGRAEHPDGSLELFYTRA